MSNVEIIYMTGMCVCYLSMVAYFTKWNANNHLNSFSEFIGIEVLIIVACAFLSLLWPAISLALLLYWTFNSLKHRSYDKKSHCM